MGDGLDEPDAVAVAVEEDDDHDGDHGEAQDHGVGHAVERVDPPARKIISSPKLVCTYRVTRVVTEKVLLNVLLSVPPITAAAQKLS